MKKVTVFLFLALMPELLLANDGYTQSDKLILGFFAFIIVVFIIAVIVYFSHGKFKGKSDDIIYRLIKDPKTHEQERREQERQEQERREQERQEQERQEQERQEQERREQERQEQERQEQEKRIIELERKIETLNITSIYDKISDQLLQKINIEGDVLKEIIENKKKQEEEIKKQNEKIKKQEEEIEKQNVEIKKQNVEIEKQNVEVKKQEEKIQEQNKNLDKKIIALKIEDKIKDALLDIPSKKISENYLMNAINKKERRLKKQSFFYVIFSMLNLFLGLSISIIVILYMLDILKLPNNQDFMSKILNLFIPESVSNKKFIMNIISRGSYIILGELLAFFFLRLYRTTLYENKYVNNEFSNFENQIIGMFLMKNKEEADNDIENKVIEELIKTERNFVIKKDEKTITESNIEHNESQIKSYLAPFIKLFGSVKK